MSKHVVATVPEIPPGSRKRVMVKGRPVVVFNLDGEYFGLLDRCPHQGGSLCEGRLIGLLEAHEPGDYSYTRRGEIVRCPWHGWEFDIRTGRRSEEHTSELQSLMRISYAVFCLKKKKQIQQHTKLIQ